MNRRGILLALAGLLPTVALAVGEPMAPPLRPYSATYEVLRKGSALGTSTLTLERNADGTWSYRSKLEATHGMASFLGGRVAESSHFRVHDGRIEALGYDYRMHVAFKDRHRVVNVDWPAGTVSVAAHDGKFHYATQPGMVERHLLVLVLARAVADGEASMSVPVAVKDRVEMQTFAVRGKARVTVPAGTFDAVRVDRTHDAKGYSVWFAPERFGTAPVKLVQDAGGDITLLLKSFKRP